MRYACVCSGISAPTVAWKPLGWEPAFFSEIEAFPSAVLAHHYPDVPNRGDMSLFSEWPDESIELLVAGTPCQSFSVAGLRKGMDDPRGNLTLVFLALVAKYRPGWLVWKNVPAVLSSNGGRDFGAFLGGLGELGYGWAYRCLDAQWFGLAQRRKRVFVVAHSGDWRRAAAVLFEPEGLRGDSPPSREAGEGIAPTISARPTGGGGLGTDFDCDGGLIASTGEISHCLNAGGMGRIDYETETLIAHPLCGEGFDASEDGTGRGTPLVPVPFDTTQITSAVNYSRPQPGDPCHPLASEAHPPAVAFHARQDPISDIISMPLETKGPHGVQSGATVRRLTPRECERLQGFPDDYTLVPYRGKPAADGPRYKALGNSMAVPVVRWIGNRIMLVEQAIKQQHAA